MSKTRQRGATSKPPQNPPASGLFERAMAFHQQNHLAQAKALYLEILGQAPARVDVLNLLGILACQEGDFAAAAQHLGQVVRLDPRNASAHSNLGYALRELKRPDEAVASCDRALALMPDFVDALCNRATALSDLGRHEEALAGYDRALKLAPGSALAHRSRGNMLIALNRPAEAAASYGRALALDPNDADAHYNRGIALRELGRHQEALACYDRSLALRPGSAEASRNRGIALCELGRYEEATKEFERLLNAGRDIEFLPGDLLHAKLQCCDWQDHGRYLELVERGIAAGKRVATPFVFLSMRDAPLGQLNCARIYAEAMAPPVPPVRHGERSGHDRIRLAYLSADFRDHPVSHLIAGVIEAHDRSRFETIAISFGPDGRDAMRQRLETAFDRFVDIRSRSDREAALLMTELQIDIAIDLTGYTGACRPGILVQRPAPVQVNYFGYPGTMGAAAVDYIIADCIVIPEAQHRFYSEKVAVLPDAYLPCDGGRPIAERTPSRAELGLPESGFVFCAFNNGYKISPAIFDIWMRLLNRVAGSVLWLSIGNPAAKRNLRRAAESRRVAPERLVFAPRVPLMADHLARHRQADLMLDSLPYNAHTTATDALWAGLPIVTCLGAGFAGRVAGSLLHAVGLPELVTETLPDYEALALALAQDPARLAAIAAKLAGNRETAPLFDTGRYCRNLERAYTEMWQRHQRGEPPASFTVTV